MLSYEDLIHSCLKCTINKCYFLRLLLFPSLILQDEQGIDTSRRRRLLAAHPECTLLLEDLGEVDCYELLDCESSFRLDDEGEV